MEPRDSEKKIHVTLNFDNKELLKSLISVVSNYSLDLLNEGFALKFSEVLEQIFISGLQEFDEKGNPNVRKFLSGSLEFLDQQNQGSTNSNNSSNSRQQLVEWISKNLESGTLSKKLALLLSDTEHVNSFYIASAFIRSELYSNALMVCLLAIERKQLNFLSQIDRSLYESSNITTKKGHKRSSSQPHMTQIVKSTTKPQRNLIRSKTFDTKCDSKIIYSLKFRPWQSLPDIQTSVVENRQRSKTISAKEFKSIDRKMVQQKIFVPKVQEIIPKKSEKVPSFHYSDTIKTCSTTPNLEKCPIVPEEIENIRIHYDCKDCRFSNNNNNNNNKNRLTSKYSTGSSCYSAGASPAKTSLTPKKSFLDIFDMKKVVYEGQKQPPSLGTSPTEFGIDLYNKDVKRTMQPSLKHAITTGNIDIGNYSEERSRKVSTRESVQQMIRNIQCHRIETGLEQENAHFIISEALIATIEQIKWNRSIKEKYNITEAKGLRTPTVPRTKQILLKNKNFKISPPKKQTKFVIGSADTDTDSNCSSEDLSQRRNSDCSDSIQEHAAQIEWDDPAEASSAENIALMLIKRFNHKRIKPENLKWLVKDGQAPQEMLPLPDGFVVNPDDCIVLNADIRGTKEWAPPRNQVIFTKHPFPDRKKIMSSQNNLCPGCGLKAIRAYAHRFRYCEYYGKFFCSGCHKEQKARIPARILVDWDFELYSVSTSAYKFLRGYRDVPIFHVGDLNPKLYQKAKSLYLSREKRTQLIYLQQFMDHCRFADESKKIFRDLPFPHWLGDPDIWSMADFDYVMEGYVIIEIEKIIAMCEKHIANCELCMARGFLCEGCPKKDLIFPWHTNIKRCSVCGSCYHDKCYNDRCSKCERLKKYGKKIVGK